MVNTANNSRRRESRNTIEQIFIELLQDKELEDISVSDICKRSGLNRSTFYANYDDIYALADTIKDELEKQVLDLYKDEMQGMQDINCISWHDYLRLFHHMKDNQLFYKTYFKLGMMKNTR